MHTETCRLQEQYTQTRAQTGKLKSSGLWLCLNMTGPLWLEQQHLASGTQKGAVGTAEGQQQ